MPALGQEGFLEGSLSTKGYWNGSRYVTKEAWQKDPKNPNNSTTPTKSSPSIAPDEKIRITAPKVNGGSTSSLRYPREINGDTDYVVFEFFDYDAPFGRAEGETTPIIDNSSSAKAFYDRSGSKEKKKPAGLSTIILYMPEDIQSQYGARWGGADFSTASVGLARLAGTDLAGPGVTVSSGAGIYEGSQLRTFSLSFKMTPKNDTEALEIKRICNTFKKAMLPSFGGQALLGTIEAASLITVPKLCQVTYMKGGEVHPYLPVYKLCAIAGVDVNYTPDGSYATYRGGSPVATRLSLSFKETKLLFAQDIDSKGGISY